MRALRMLWWEIKYRIDLWNWNAERSRVIRLVRARDPRAAEELTAKLDAIWAGTDTREFQDGRWEAERQAMADALERVRNLRS